VVDESVGERHFLERLRCECDAVARSSNMPVGKPYSLGRPWMTAAVVATLAATRVPAAQAPTPTLNELLDRTAVYTRDAIVKLSNVVCEEEYAQENRGLPTLRRRLSSEVLLVRHPVETENWMLFRDTTAVDGKEVAERSDRLTQLFVQPTDDTWARARAISTDSERHHIVKPPTSVANPMLGPAVLQRRYQPKLKFTLRGQDREIGPNATIVDFEEPSILRNKKPLGEGPPVISPYGASGRAWIEAGTGRIVKTDVRLAIDLGRNTTTFVRDPRLGIDRPSEMRTSWPGRGGGGTVTGVATYGMCRRFGVETSETLLPLQ
jgi:hypothetical protein